MATQKAPCILCTRETTHNILATANNDSEEGSDRFFFLQCAGCGAVSMGNVSNIDGSGENVQYYPSPISRKMPTWSWKLSWFGGESELLLGELLREIYQAVQGKQYRLALMGIRAFLEQLMVIKVGDKGTFDRNLSAFQDEGYISKIQRNAMNDILDSGHAVIHRMHKPTEADLNVALDIMEAITATIVFHEQEAKLVASKVPPRNKS